MNLEELKKSNRIIFECVAGSRLYGTNTPCSDFDIRGFYVNPPLEYLGLTRTEPEPQINDEKHNIVYYSLKRVFELLEESNPNFCELLYCPEDCIKIKKLLMDELIANRHLFISKRAYNSHIQYSRSQIIKAKGANKMVNQPELFKKPVKEDFCWIIDELEQRSNECQMPYRPVPLKSAGKHFGNINHYHVSALEHVANTYRLYYYGTDSKGVFRGDDMLVCESIPFDDERKRFAGLLIYNKHEYEKALEQHRKYIGWVNNRNPSRYTDQENKKIDYDKKNMAHCVRLLMAGEHILTYGYPLVRLEGKQLAYVMSICNAEKTYEEIMKDVDERMARLETLHKTSTIPEDIDRNKTETLYRYLSGLPV